MFDKLILYYASYFTELNEQNKDGYLLLTSTVAIMLLHELYNKFMKDGIEPIESLSKEQKEKFWIAAKKYCTEENKNKDRIKASKAAYVLSLITSSE